VKEAGLDLGVLVFTASTALLMGIVFGIVPTVQTLHMQANDALKEGGTRHVGSARMSAIRTALTVGEVAMALVLTIGAALFLRSFANVRGVEAGFDPRGVLVASLAAPDDAADDGRTVQFFDRVLARLVQVPGVRAAAASSAVPFVSNETSPFRVEGLDTGQDAPLGMAEQPKVTPDYFRVMDIALLRGRTFGTADVVGAEPVAIVSKGFADRFWPGGNALDKRVAITDGRWRRIVGIAADVRNDGLEAPAKPTIYIAFSQFPRAASSITLRLDSMSTTTMAAVRDAVREVAPTQPLFGAQPMETVVGEALSLRRFLMVLVGGFAGLAVVLGLVGVYGVLAYLVGQRRQELAVRAALGATRTGILRMVVWRGVALGGVGVTLGLAGSVALSRVLEGALFGISPLDPVTYALASGLLLGVVVAASSVPAWQAARVPAIEALKG
jgi:putative ABC transport system permease protein